MIYLTLFGVFFKIDLFGYGGGLGMLPLIFQSVQEFSLVTAKEFSDLVAISQVTPGPIAVNAATFVGFSTAGVGGAAVATIGVVLPSFVLVLVAMKFMEKFQGSKGLEGVLKGIRPATVGLIAAAVIFVAETSLFNCEVFSKELFADPANMINIIPCIICAVTAVLVGKFKLSPIVAILMMGGVGAFVCG